MNPTTGPYQKKSWHTFLEEAYQVKNFTLWDTLHGYIYSRWIYQYISFGIGNLLAARFFSWIYHLFFLGFNKQGSAKELSGKSKASFADGYHGKVISLNTAHELVSVKENIQLPDLEYIIPYPKARDLILLNPDHLAVLECPCRAAQEKPCLPMDVCLIVGEPFASIVLERHPKKSRRITSVEACEIIQAEDDRGHAHHAFFKDAMLGRFYAICNCCSCCCGAIQAHRNGTPMLAASGYVCQVNGDDCLACGICVSFCQFDALSQQTNQIRVDEQACMGCGVCVSKCQNNALSLVRDVKHGEPFEINSLLTVEN